MVLALMSLAFLASILFRLLREEIMVDRCLSGLHGSFDYSTRSCDLRENHPFVPYSARHYPDEMAAALAAGLTTAFVWAFWYVRQGGRTH